MNKISEHSKKVRIKTSHEWITKKTKEGGYNFNVLITDKDIAEFARNEIKNKRQFLINAIQSLRDKNKMA